MFDAIYKEAAAAAKELCEAARLTAGAVVVVGCSTSEVIGDKIGTHSDVEVAGAVFRGIYDILSEKGIFLAAQCCEHLNRALIVERTAVPGGEPVNVVPQPKAGGAFATTAYQTFNDPIALEEIRADAGLDIGGTLIGMHLKRVAVPLRLTANRIGKAPLTAARTRMKTIGGSRAVYDEDLL